MFIIRNLNLISVHSWTYLELASTVASGNCYHPNSSAVSHEKQIHTTIPDANANNLTTKQLSKFRTCPAC